MNTTDPLNEIFPLVDENDNVIGKISRKEANTNPNIIHRAAGAFIFNTKGELLLQKRSATKDTFPDCWDVSVGGHVDYGDDYLNTAVREISEEVGIKVNKEDLQLLGKILIKLPWENEFWQIYKYTLKNEIEIKKNQDEVAQIKYVSLVELKSMLEDTSIKWSDKARLLFSTFLLKTNP